MATTSLLTVERIVSGVERSHHPLIRGDSREMSSLRYGDDNRRGDSGGLSATWQQILRMVGCGLP